ncbi:MAG: IS200/IS605 family accessory protein TnpB-related protein [Thermoprotei archaeon]|nr:IS200/IS605 family accessory protein TnpB-related protein [Thermoprotei archaeon]
MEAIRRHGRRARSILLDSTHYVSRRIVEVAKEYNALIVLEDLNKLRTRANGSRRFNKKLTLWTYHRVQSYIHYKALVKNLPVIYTDPRNTSRTSPIGGKLEFVNYRWAKLPNRYIVARDLIASWNLALRGLKLFTQDVELRGRVELRKPPARCKPKKE